MFGFGFGGDFDTLDRIAIVNLAIVFARATGTDDLPLVQIYIDVLRGDEVGRWRLQESIRRTKRCLGYECGPRLYPRRCKFDTGHDGLCSFELPKDPA